MTYDELMQAVRDTRRTLLVADTAADDIATLLPGRLKRVSSDTLVKLKEELRDFNIQTRRWKK